MKYNKNVWEKVVQYFTITRVLELGWNGIAFLYHCLWLGMGNWTSMIIQVTALLTEWLVTSIYENYIFMNNVLVNNQFDRNKRFKRFLHKYWRFTMIFILVFVSTYFIRLLILYWIGWQITGEQLQRAMINTIPVALIGGPLLGYIYISRREKRQKKRTKKIIS